MALPLPLLLAAAEEFPRGTGFYFSLWKLVPVVAVYLAWVRTCWWVDDDARSVKLPRTTWNPILCAGALLGLVILWALPGAGVWFFLSFTLLLALYLGPTLTYVYFRNQKVPEDKRAAGRNNGGAAKSTRSVQSGPTPC